MATFAIQRAIKELTLLCHLSCIWLFATLWTVARQAPVSGIPTQEDWSGLSFPTPGNLHDPRIKPESPACISCISRQLLYHLSYQGSPLKRWVIAKEIRVCKPQLFTMWTFAGGKKKLCFSLRYLTWNSRNTSLFKIKKVLSTKAPTSCHATFCAQTPATPGAFS